MPKEKIKSVQKGYGEGDVFFARIKDRMLNGNRSPPLIGRTTEKKNLMLTSLFHCMVIETDRLDWTLRAKDLIPRLKNWERYTRLSHKSQTNSFPQSTKKLNQIRHRSKYIKKNERN